MSVLEHKELVGHWETLIKEHTESGMTIKEWCHKHGGNEFKYYYWSRTLRADAAGPVQSEYLLWNFLLSAELPRLQRQIA